MVKEITFTKFDASLDIDVRLGVDPRMANQMVRGVVSLPHGTAKVVRVLVLCTPDAEAAAKEAGAAYVGLDEYIEKIKGCLLYTSLFDDTFLADGAEGNGFDLQVISEHAFTVLHGQHQVFRAYSLSLIHILTRSVPVPSSCVYKTRCFLVNPSYANRPGPQKESLLA